MSSRTVDAAERRPSRWASMRTRTKVMLAIFVVVLLAVVAGFGIKVPYVILRPGPAPNTLGTFEGKKVLTLSGAKTYPTSGGLHFTTVSMVGGPGNRPSLIEYGLAKLDDHAQIYEESQLFAPQTTREQVQQQNEAEMTGSQSSAEVVAARQAGYDVPEMIEIAGISDSASEAKKLLRVKDVIVSVNGVRIADSLSLQREMKKVTPGQKVQLGITRGGKAMTFAVPTTKVDDRAVMGLTLNPKATMPFKVNISVGDVGGPSAGTMFALAIYDELTPGALTGGKQIAGTGTMDSAGDVGAIGGIREKVVGARQAGATAFLAPADNCAELKGHVPNGLDVYRVATIKDAISTVEHVADGSTQGLPRCG